MNVNFDLKYLTGGDAYFGPNYGGATINTLSRKGYAQECSNVGQLVQNLKFSLTMENEIIGEVLNNAQNPKVAAKAWITKHPDVLDNWLQGVTTYQGKSGLDAVKQHLAL